MVCEIVLRRKLTTMIFGRWYVILRSSPTLPINRHRGTEKLGTYGFNVHSRMMAYSASLSTQLMNLSLLSFSWLCVSRLVTSGLGSGAV